MFGRFYAVRAVKTLVDALALCIVYCLAFFIRYEGWLAPDVTHAMLSFLPYVLLLKLICMGAFKVPSLSWRFASLLEPRLLFSLAMGSGLLCIWKLASEYPAASIPAGQHCRIPLSVLLIDLVLSFVGVVVLRLTVRLWSERFDRTRLAVPGHGKV